MTLAGLDTIIIRAVLGLLVGYTLYKVKRMNEKLENAIDQKGARTLIEDKIEHLKVTDREAKEDIQRLEAKIDKLLILQMEQAQNRD